MLVVYWCIVQRSYFFIPTTENLYYFPNWGNIFMYIIIADVCTVIFVVIYCSMVYYISILFRQFCLNVDIFWFLFACIFVSMFVILYFVEIILLVSCSVNTFNVDTLLYRWLLFLIKNLVIFVVFLLFSYVIHVAGTSLYLYWILCIILCLSIVLIRLGPSVVWAFVGYIILMYYSFRSTESLLKFWHSSIVKFVDLTREPFILFVGEGLWLLVVFCH